MRLINGVIALASGASLASANVNVYDTTKINEEVKAAQTLAQFETKGSFGTCVDIVCCLHIQTLYQVADNAR